MFFRADMNNTVASGHVMRCLAIADGYREAGEDSVFLTADSFGADFIRGRGYSVIVLNTKWDDMEGEIPAISKVICENSIQTLFVDSYQVTKEYLKELQRLTSVIYMDDRNAFTYPVDMVVSYGNWIKEEEYRNRYAGTGTALLLGTSYVPLRREFSEVSGNHDEYDLFLTTGGTDPFCVAAGLLEILQRELPELRIAAVSKVLQKSVGLGMKFRRIEIFEHVENMASLMANSRMAVSATGTTLFELCACRVPTVCFSFADNQVPFGKTMGALGAAEYAGDVRTNPRIISDIAQRIKALSADFSKQKRMAEKMRDVTDGNGVKRIVEQIEGFKTHRALKNTEGR